MKAIDSETRISHSHGFRLFLFLYQSQTWNMITFPSFLRSTKSRKNCLHQTLTSNEPWAAREKCQCLKPLLQFNMRRKIAVCLWSCQLDCFPFQLRSFFLCRNSCSSARLSLNLSSISGGQFRSSLVFINYRKQASLHHILPRHWACG